MALWFRAPEYPDEIDDLDPALLAGIYPLPPDTGDERRGRSDGQRQRPSRAPEERVN